MAREDVNDAVDRLGGAVGVQRREGQVARLGDRQTGVDRLVVAHFADEHDVWVLTEGVLQRGAERLGVRSHFALIDDAPLVLVDELDWIFDGEDMPLPLAIDLVDHRREGGGLPRARRAGDEHEAARLLRELGDDGGETQVGERLDVERNLAQHDGDAAALLEAVAAEAREVLDAEREVELVLHLETLLLVLREHRVGELQRVLGLHHHFGARGRDVAVDAHNRAGAGGDVQVGGAALDHLLE